MMPRRDPIARRYEVIGPPLRGGMGIVHLCMDLRTDQPVALKTFKPEFLSKPRVRDEFLHEAQLWVSLGSHSHVVHAYGVDRCPDTRDVYIVMELVPKTPGLADASLRQWLAATGSPPPEVALLFALQVARGMGYAVATVPGLVHRDLKPENLLVGADPWEGTRVGRLRIADFGLSVIKQSLDLQGPRPRGFAGTPSYAAPEQWQGGALGIWTDVYAFGCILHELATGHLAASGSLDAIRQAHCSGEVSQHTAAIPAFARDIAARCVAPETTARYQTWSEVEHDLAESYEKITGTSPPAAPGAVAVSRAERVAQGFAYAVLGVSYVDIGDPAAAEAAFCVSRSIAEAEQDPHLEMVVTGNDASVQLAKGHLDQALQLLMQQLELARRLGDREVESVTLANIVPVYRRLEQYPLALEFGQHALSVARELRHRGSEMHALQNLAAVHLCAGDFQESLNLSAKALDLALATGDRHQEVLAFDSMATVALAARDDKAVPLAFEAARRAHEIGDTGTVGTALSTAGAALFLAGDRPQAFQAWDAALIALRGVGDREGTAATLSRMASLCARDNPPELVLPIARQAAELWEELGSRNAEAARRLVARLTADLASANDDNGKIPT
jgi:tetratricopeptide (TPR) repeat protein